MPRKPSLLIPSPRKLPSGSWHIQLRLGGRSISVTEPTEAACIKKARQIKASHKQEAADLSRTLGAVLDRYIAVKAPVLSPSTVRGYKAIRRTRFQTYMLGDPSRLNWQRVVSDEAALCSAKTLRNAWGLIKAALLAGGYEAPRVTLPQVVVEDHPYLEADQLQTFLSAIRDKPCELAALLGLHGLRRSEMFALRWQDVDLSAGQLRVSGALVHDADGKLVRKKETKNRTSRRTVPIMLPRLTELLSAVPEKDRTGAILTCHPNSVYKAVNSICEKAGLPQIGVHGLRHTFTSAAFSAGLSEQETMSLGGWRDPNTMRKIYTHLDAAAREKAASALSDFYSCNT